jgi:hypothetical protein
MFVLCPLQIVAFAADAATVGRAFTTTVSAALPLSHPATVWLTYQTVEPTVEVLGIGAELLPVPPVLLLYHMILLPVALSEAAVAFLQ